MKKFTAIIMSALLCVAMLAGCSNSAPETDVPENVNAEEEGNNAAEEADAAEEVPEEEEAADESSISGGEIATVTEGVLTVGTNAEFPPFEYVGDDGEPDGFDMALIREIGKRMGKEVVVENMEFASLVSSIGTKIDVAIAGMTITEEREEAVDFSNSYYNALQYVILPADSDISAPADLENKRIGVQLGTTGDFIAEEINGATVSQYNKAVDAVNDLINDRVDCVIIDKNPALVFESRFEGQVIAVDGADFEFEAEEYAIAVDKGNGALLEGINKALADIIADGTFDELVETYIEGE